MSVKVYVYCTSLMDGFPLHDRGKAVDQRLLLGTWSCFQMEVLGNSVTTGPANVIFLSSILGRDGPVDFHKCDWKCENENVCGNMFRCKMTGATHICDKNCNQKILYDNHSSLCRVSGQILPLSPVEQQAVRGVRRKFDADASPADSCAHKRRRNTQLHPSPFERSFLGPVYSPVADGMDMS